MTSTTAPTQSVTSADGTTIAVEAVGSGPPVVLVDGAMCLRAQGPARPLAEALADRFTVYIYDRRGRGESGDTQPYAPQREIEDLAAVIALAGGEADVYGISSGAALSLDAAAAGIGVRRLAVYEAPFIVTADGPVRDPELIEKTETLVAQGKRGAAVRLFMRTVGVPAPFVWLMGLFPMWRTMTGIAHTLPYDYRQLRPETGRGEALSADRWRGLSVPTLSMAGGKSPQYMRDAMQAVDGLLSDSRYETLPGQTHMLKPEALAPRLKEFFA
ncbi:alpha/beta fold hydrolase [Spongisporangium articulatum]|uniref:Alpha/beta fold hydrolase n=1 Tax=Spongisporangium articulatum TaxID=3362603 RepID=A0ABW8APH3_9ACTN